MIRSMPCWQLFSLPTIMLFPTGLTWTCWMSWKAEKSSWRYQGISASWQSARKWQQYMIHLRKTEPAGSMKSVHPSCLMWWRNGKVDIDCETNNKQLDIGGSVSKHPDRSIVELAEPFWYEYTENHKELTKYVWSKPFKTAWRSDRQLTRWQHDRHSAVYNSSKYTGSGQRQQSPGIVWETSALFLMGNYPCRFKWAAHSEMLFSLQCI